ncbi:MAG: hydroxyacid dehydrogenase [Chloroflexi bacterium]|nr:hydroxyacid dehydrogenase [Chloroflexota bacterium]
MIVVSEVMWPAGLDVLTTFASTLYDPSLWRRPEEMLRHLRTASALIVRNQTRVDGQLMERAPKLKVVGRLGVGLDNIDLDEAQQRDIAVTWAKGANAISVAEFVIGSILTLARQFHRLDPSVRQGEWNRPNFSGSEIYGKCLGVIGLGDIGRKVCDRACALGMRLLAFDPYITQLDPTMLARGVKMSDLDTLLGESDFVSIHVPLTASTHHAIGARELGLLPKGAYLINTSRGGVIDEVALYAALKERRIAGAALDVREQEPPPDDDPFRSLDNVLMSPHVAGFTEEAQTRTSIMVAEDVIRVLQGGRPHFPAIGELHETLLPNAAS